MPSRRRVLRGAAAGVTATLAGCGRSLRANTAPGGLELVNDRATPASVVVRAALVPDATGTPDPASTPVPVEEAAVQGRFSVPGNATRYAPRFFPEPGRYVVEASADGARHRTSLELYRSLGGGGVGVDTAVIRLVPDGVRVDATGVD
ncbi:hypothetical protein HUG10_01890 [Halorarum halophilum]|uniref:Uncharacterized protein n=1 Tax=Halorarum halophilum TaxID=2743090 RepID=A0A7D5GD33_9EURY|nr:hypothetical protein [Halobaculum halophilum]QLG26368.1 hypothetical protein HUG10_01890 [Halobaculum halophilum]